MSYEMDGDADTHVQRDDVAGGRIVIGSLAQRVFGGPWFGVSDAPGAMTSIVNFVLEAFAVMLLVIAVPSVRFFGALAGTDILLQGALVGLTYAGIYMLATEWTTDFKLKRHLNPAITLGYCLKFSGDGPIHGLLGFAYYLAAQVGGAMLGAWWLTAFGTGSLPNPTTAVLGGTIPGQVALLDTTALGTGVYWVLEFVGSFFIVLITLYNDHLHQDNNATGRSTESERENSRRTARATTLTIFILCLSMYPFGEWTWNGALYLGTLVGVGPNLSDGATGTAGNNSHTPLIDWAHYCFTPFAGAVAGAIVAFGIIKIMEWVSHPNRPSWMRNRIAQRYSMPSAQTELTQPLVQGREPAGLVNRNAKISVREFSKAV